MVAQRAERRAYRHQCVSQWGEKAAAFKCVVPWSIHCQWRNTCCRWRHKRDGSGHKWGWKGVNALWLRCRPWGPRAASRHKLLHTNWSRWFCYALPKSCKAFTCLPIGNCRSCPIIFAKASFAVSHSWVVLLQYFSYHIVWMGWRLGWTERK